MRSGYCECYEAVKTARMSNPVNTNELERIRDFYGFDLYLECLKAVTQEADNEKTMDNA